MTGWLIGYPDLESIQWFKQIIGGYIKKIKKSAWKFENQL